MRLLLGLVVALAIAMTLATWGMTSNARDDDAIIVLLDAAPNALDPRMATSDYDGKLSRMVFAGLLTFDTEDGHPAGALAASWTWVDATTLDVTLREGIVFHDGTPITSADVVATWESLRDPRLASPIAASVAGVTLRALDAHRIRFGLEAPDASFLVRLDLGILPAGTVTDVATPRALVEGRIPGSGPWRLTRWGEGRSVRLDPHAAATVDEQRARAAVVLRVVPDANTRMLTMLGGRADVLQNAVPPALLPAFAREGDRPASWAITSRPSFKYSYIVMNLDAPPLDDRRVRAAIAHAIDRDAIVRSRLGGRATLARGMLPPTHWAHAADVPTWGYDPARSRELLDEAGLEPGPDGCRATLTWKVSTNRLYRSVAEAMAGQLADVGLCVRVQAWEWGTFFEDVRQGRFELASLQWTSVLDPDIHRWTFHGAMIPEQANGWTGANRGRYRNATLDALLDVARGETDDTARASHYAEVQRIVAADLPYIPLWHEDHVVITSARARSYAAVPTGRFAGLTRVEAPR